MTISPTHDSTTLPDVRPERLVHGALWLGGGEFFSRIVGLVVAVYLARVLGTEGYGLVGTALAFVSYFLILVAGGVEFHGVRDVAQYPDRLPAIVGHVLGARVILLVGSLLLMAVLILVLPSGLTGRIDLVGVYALTLVTYSFNTTWALRGLQQMRTIATGLVLQNVLLAAMTFALVRGPHPMLWLVPAIQVVSEGALVWWYLKHLRARFGRLAPVLKWTQLVPTIKETLHVSLGRIPRVFYFQGDILLLAWLLGASSAGEFLASHKIILSIVMVGIMYEMSVFPEASRLAASSAVDALAFQMNVLRHALVAIAPLVALSAAYAIPLIDLIYGNEFAGSATVFSWMLLTVPVLEASIVLQDLLIAMRMNNAFIAANLAGMTAHILVGIVIIPGLGGRGAALASLIGEFIGLLLLTIFVQRRIGRFPYSRRMLAPLAGGLVMYAVIQGARHWPLVVAATLAMLSYIAVALALGALTKRELIQLRSVVTRLMRTGHGV